MIMMTGHMVRVLTDRILSAALAVLAVLEASAAIRMQGVQHRMHRHSILMQLWIILVTATIKKP